MGTDNDKRWKLATDYSKFLGTSEMSPAEVQQEFYKLGCNLLINCGSETIQITLSGLSNNFDESVRLLENILSSSVENEEALVDLKSSSTISLEAKQARTRSTELGRKLSSSKHRFLG